MTHSLSPARDVPVFGDREGVVVIFVGDDSLSGVLLVILGIPWTMIITNVLDALAPGLIGGVAIGLTIGTAGCAINAAIIYFVTRWIVKVLDKRAEGAE